MTATYLIPANIKTTQGELQDTKLWQLSSNPSSLVEGLYWYDTVNHVPKYYNGTSAKEFGRTYTFSTGLTNTNDTITVTDYNKLLKNTSTGTNCLTILGTATTQNYSINIGAGSYATSANCVALGYNAVAAGGYSTALGNGAAVTSDYSIQLGFGQNETANSLSVGFGIDPLYHPNQYNWILLDGITGLIPDARLSSNIAKTSDLSNYLATSLKGANNGVAELDSSGKVPTSQLPAFVDDVIDSYIVSGATALSSGWLSLTDGGSALTPETGKIYVVLSSGAYQNKTYRWSGTTYVEISASPGAATESAPGIIEIATQAETNTGTDDTRAITPLKLATFTNGMAKKITGTNPALTASGGVVTWTVTNSLSNANVNVQVFEVSSNTQVMAEVSATASTITIKMNSTSNVSAGVYRAIIIG